MRQIDTLTQLHDLQNSTWIYAVVVCAIAIFGVEHDCLARWK